MGPAIQRHHLRRGRRRDQRPPQERNRQLGYLQEGLPLPVVKHGRGERSRAQDQQARLRIQHRHLRRRVQGARLPDEVERPSQDSGARGQAPPMA